MLPKTKNVKIIKIAKKYVTVEFKIESTKQTVKCIKDRLQKLINSMQENEIYCINRMEFIGTIWETL